MIMILKYPPFTQLAKIEAFYRLASDWAKKFVMSKSTVAILTKLKHILINISVEVANNF